MQREINVRELESTIEKIDDIEEPIIIKRDNKSDLIVISLERYQEEMFLRKLEISRKQYKEGKVHEVRRVFKELREKYEY